MGVAGFGRDRRAVERDGDRRHELESEGQGESGARRESEKIGRRPAGEGKEQAAAALLDLGFGGRV